MDIRDLLLMMSAGAIIGAFGQSLRMVVGLSKAKDEASQKGVDFGKDVFDGNRLLVSLLIGAIAGGLGILTITNFQPLPGDKITGQTFFGLIGIGYAGTDFIEGFIARYLPKKDASPKVSLVALTPPVAQPALPVALQVPVSAAAVIPQQQLSAISLPLVRALAAAAPALSRVELSCKGNYAEGKADCNRFAKLVAADFGITLLGDANEIARQIASNTAAANGWTFLGDGVDAGKQAVAAAARGELVLGARDEGDSHHGHASWSSAARSGRTCTHGHTGAP